MPNEDKLFQEETIGTKKVFKLALSGKTAYYTKNSKNELEEFNPELEKMPKQEYKSAYADVTEKSAKFARNGNVLWGLHTCAMKTSKGERDVKYLIRWQANDGKWSPFSSKQVNKIAIANEEDLKTLKALLN